MRWARETADLAPGEAAYKIALRPTKEMTPVERLQQLEAGEAAPTRTLLVRMAEQYQRPLLTFYLSGVPKEGDRGTDFRTLPDGNRPTDDAYLDVLVRNMMARQNLLRAALEDEDEADQIEFVGSKAMSDGVQAVVESIRETLPMGLCEFREAAGADTAFLLLRKAVESVGVYVILDGKMGSYHTSINLQSFRGFALSDPVAPFVVLNSHIARAQLSYTLLHQLAHIWLGNTGICGDHAGIATERFCNDVASEFLLSSTELQQFAFPGNDNDDACADAITLVARKRNICPSMVVYKLYRQQRIDREVWSRLSNRFRAEWVSKNEGQRELSRNDNATPGSYWTHRVRVGDALVEVVQRLMQASALTTTKAGIVLGVKAKDVEGMINAGRGGHRN